MDERENEQLNSHTPSGGMDEFTLESILAEYKGSAFIEGAKRTPQDELEAQTRRIVLEETGGIPSMEGTEPEAQTGREAEPLGDSTSRAHREKRPPRKIKIKNAYEIQYDPPRDPDEEEETSADRRHGDVHIQAFSDMSETEQEFFGIGKYARASAVEEKRDEAEAVIEETAQREKKRVERRRRPTIARERPPEPEDIPEPPEPSLRQTGAAYAKSVRPLKRRGLIALLFSLILVYMSAALSTKLWLPQALKADMRLFAMTALIFLLLVLYTGRDLLVRGLADLVHGHPGAESLVSVACVASAADAIYIAASGSGAFGAPFCAAAAFSMACAILGTHLCYSGFRRTYKTAVSSAAPYVVRPEQDRVKDGSVLVKTQTDMAGFVSRTDEEDGAAHAYAFAAPLLLIASVLFALMTAVRGGMDAFFHNFAALAAVSASCAALVSYGLPFASAAKHLGQVGAAIAGWSGACDIRDAIGVVITDNDVFPAGTMTLNGVRVFAGASLNKVLSYTGSVVMASGSGLAPLFSELLKQQSSSTVPVESFTCYEGGGIGAVIRGERVLVGSSGFMNLMGVRVPQNLGVKTAVYAAISGDLVGVFAVNYTPVNSVQHALVTILRTKILPLLAVRDFNMTPLMIQQKFKITTDKLDYLTVDARYKLSDERETGNARPVALLCREGLGPLAEIIAAGRQFRSAVRGNTLITMIGTVAGLLLTFYLCWNRAYDSLSAFNMVLYLFAWLVPVLLMSGTVKRY